MAKDFFAKRLGSTKLETQTFNAGPAEIEAMLGGDLDAGFIGPNPAINAFAKTEGEASGSSPAPRPAGPRWWSSRHQLGGRPQGQEGRHSAARQHPGRGAARLAEENGLTTDSQGGRATSRSEPTENATTCNCSRTRSIDGAWVPEPWASRLVLDGGGKVLVDEKTLWPGASSSPPT